MKNKKIPELAFLLGYLIPGMGHFYLGKRGKSIFFTVILIFTFLAGFYLCDFGHIAPFERNVETHRSETRYSFLAQAGIGLLALVPALVQKFEIKNLKDSPKIVEPNISLGMLYMMVAGLLNILVAQNAYEIASSKKEIK